MNNINSTIPLKEGVRDFGIFKAVFMAGSPGSGKSTVRHLLFGGLGLKTVDADEVRRAWQNMGREGDYEQYGEVVRRQRQSYMQERLGIVMDTTAWWLPSIKATTQQLKDLGYDVGMVHVFAPLHVSAKRVADRAAKTGRDVPVAEVEKRYHALKNNVRDLIELFGNHYWFVDNSGDHPHVRGVAGEVRRWLREPPSSATARDWIQARL
jgi:predicted ABC-type ATPase